MDELEKTIEDINPVGRSKDIKTEFVKQGCEICFADNKTNNTRKDEYKENNKEE